MLTIFTPCSLINLEMHSAVYQDISEYEIVTDLADINKESTKIKLLLQKTVTKLDVEAHTVELNDGQTIEYNKVRLILFCQIVHFLGHSLIDVARFCLLLEVHQNNFLTKVASRTLPPSELWKIFASLMLLPRRTLIL